MGVYTQMWEDGKCNCFLSFKWRQLSLTMLGESYNMRREDMVLENWGTSIFITMSFIDDCLCTCCDHVEAFKWGKALGWYENLSLTGKMHEVPWAHFIFDDRYSDVVDIYEGWISHMLGEFSGRNKTVV